MAKASVLVSLLSLLSLLPLLLEFLLWAAVLVTVLF